MLEAQHTGDEFDETVADAEFSALDSAQDAGTAQETPEEDDPVDPFQFAKIATHGAAAREVVDFYSILDDERLEPMVCDCPDGQFPGHGALGVALGDSDGEAEFLRQALHAGKPVVMSRALAERLGIPNSGIGGYVVDNHIDAIAAVSLLLLLPGDAKVMAQRGKDIVDA